MHIESKETRLISLKLLSDRLFVFYKIDTCLTVSADLHICKGRSSFSPHISANVFARIWITTQYFFCYIPCMQILVGLARPGFHFLPFCLQYNFWQKPRFLPQCLLSVFFSLFLCVSSEPSFYSPTFPFFCSTDV